MCCAICDSHSNDIFCLSLTCVSFGISIARYAVPIVVFRVAVLKLAVLDSVVLMSIGSAAVLDVLAFAVSCEMLRFHFCDSIANLLIKLFLLGKNSKKLLSLFIIP